jgi:hypothetical protein
MTVSGPMVGTGLETVQVNIVQNIVTEHLKTTAVLTAA